MLPFVIKLKKTCRFVTSVKCLCGVLTQCKKQEKFYALIFPKTRVPFGKNPHSKIPPTKKKNFSLLLNTYIFHETWKISFRAHLTQKLEDKFQKSRSAMQKKPKTKQKEKERKKKTRQKTNWKTDRRVNKEWYFIGPETVIVRCSSK